ncbi:MAG: hypothetical protein LBU81_06380 [Methanosarcinales archaeon]|jgi:predicted HicB family RNase H-like nuclease|nr:hypothetical protein [Methanosarcinales archaeon]
MAEHGTLPKRGPARVGRADGTPEELRIEVPAALKRDMLRKAGAREQRLNQFIKIILRSAVVQLPDKAEYRKKRSEYHRPAKRKQKTFIKIRIDPQLREQLEKKAGDREMYVSELIRDILIDANIQLSGKRKEITGDIKHDIDNITDCDFDADDGDDSGRTGV